MKYRVFIVVILIGVFIMARGHEDWFIVTDAFSKAVQDSGELGARFGIPYSFTRSGKVIYSDSFEADITPWRASVVGAGSTVTRDTTYPFRGLGCLYLETDTGVADYARVQKLLAYLDDTRTGLEFLGWFTGSAEVLRIGAEVQTPTAGLRYRVNINYDGKLEYLNASDVYVEFADLGGGFYVGHPAYYLFKLVIDMKTGNYGYMRVNETIYDMSSYTPKSLTTAIPGRIDWFLQGWSDPLGSAGKYYIDDLTITIDEP